MQYYISRTHVALDASGRLTARETVLTRPAPLKAAQEALRRYRAIGITRLHMCEHPKGSRRWGKLDREATARRKDRAMTVADIAEGLAELERESQGADDAS